MGTVPWAAPEYLTVKRIKERSEKGDIFSFGVIAWELVTRKVPWKEEGYTRDDVRELVINGERLEIPNNCPTELQEIMKQCWKHGNKIIYTILRCRTIDKAIV